MSDRLSVFKMDNVQKHKELSPKVSVSVSVFILTLFMSCCCWGTEVVIDVNHRAGIQEGAPIYLLGVEEPIGSVTSISDMRGVIEEGMDRPIYIRIETSIHERYLYRTRTDVTSRITSNEACREVHIEMVSDDSHSPALSDLGPGITFITQASVSPLSKVSDKE